MTNRTQNAIGSGFGAKTTAAEIVSGLDLSGRNAIVTGGYSGIGIETVRALTSVGASVTIPARRPGAARAAVADISGDITIAAMDLADINSVKAFAATYLETVKSLDILINNAGTMACPEARVGPGWESQFGINHLGHMALSLEMLPALKAAKGARLVALSSVAYRISDVHWDDPHFRSHPYEKWQAYGQAKSANALFARAADRKWSDFGISAFSVHPGGIFTPLQRHLSDEEMAVLGWKNADGTIPPGVEAMFKTPERGASTATWAATSADLTGYGGQYCEDCDIFQTLTPGTPGYKPGKDHIFSEEKADRLWQMSLEMLADA